ncbi:carbohydrate ABC transporter permease [Nonomuraea salmonea]|uniref:Carbohydrate ABC transporter permease n=1 Tax=Nonomuraea salmonea TaxID=46181 RepID=A0ABV5ND75_9ACTN
MTTSPLSTGPLSTGPLSTGPLTTAPGAAVRRGLPHVIAAVSLLILLYPLVWLLATSVKPADEVVTSLDLLPSHLEWSNYLTALEGVSGVPVSRLFVNTLLIAGGCVIGNLLSCSLAAYAFARLRFRMRKVMFGFMVATLMLPHHVVLIPQYIIFNRLGLVDTYWPLILPKFLATEAFFVFLIVQFMRGLPRELEESARIDGCGPFRTYWAITLPLSRPALITTAIFTFIWSWNDFLTQMIYLFAPENFTLTIALRSFVDQSSTSAYGPMFAMSVISVLPIVLFFFVFQRYLVQGMATSGLKG